MCRLREFAWRSRSTRKTHVLVTLQAAHSVKRPSSDGQGVVDRALGAVWCWCSEPVESCRSVCSAWKSASASSAARVPLQFDAVFRAQQIAPRSDERSGRRPALAAFVDERFFQRHRVSERSAPQQRPLLQLVAREGEGSADDRRTRRKSIDSSTACSARSFSPRRLSSVVSSSADHRAMRLRKWCTTSSGTSCTSHRHRSSAARTASSRGRRSGWATRPSITWCSLVSARSRRARMARSSRMCAIDTL